MYLSLDLNPQLLVSTLNPNTILVIYECPLCEQLLNTYATSSSLAKPLSLLEKMMKKLAFFACGKKLGTLVCLQKQLEIISYIYMTHQFQAKSNFSFFNRFILLVICSSKNIFKERIFHKTFNSASLTLSKHIHIFKTYIFKYLWGE